MIMARKRCYVPISGHDHDWNGLSTGNSALRPGSKPSPGAWRWGTC